MPTATEEKLDLTFAALADPTRRAILQRLAQGETSVNELAQPFHMSLPAVSKHLKVLERAGLISRSRRAQVRPARLEPEAFKVASDWLDAYRDLWEGRMDRLDAYLQRMNEKSEGAPDGPDDDA